jgi:hypothetical protein
MSDLYQMLPAGAVPFGLLAVGEQFKRIGADGLPANLTYTKISDNTAGIVGVNNTVNLPIAAYELIRPAPPAPGDNPAIVEDIRRQPAPVCVCSNCAGLLDPGECGCLCRVCSTAGAAPRMRPIRRYVLHLCPCCASTVGSMDHWCATCGQPLRAPAGAVPF